MNTLYTIERKVLIKSISDYSLELQIKSTYNIIANDKLKDICFNSFNLEYAKKSYYELCKIKNVERLPITHYLSVLIGFDWDKAYDSKGNKINSLEISNLTKGL
jgi:hypothetical protein